MLNSNNINKTDRVCTTPQRKRFVESIKKSIHRSIERIDPLQYKNILKGEYVFMHLCHKGEIINSEYTKVALFMGGIVFKKAVEKVTVVVTNQPSNKAVKKLASMGKPVLSVLWLQACFQEKRKVPHEDFFFQQQVIQKKLQQQNENSINFGSLIRSHQQQIKNVYQKFMQKHNHKFLRFIDKKQKVNKEKVHVIPVHEIDVSMYQANKAQKRRSVGVSQKLLKKKMNRKGEYKSQGDKISKVQIKDENYLTNVKEEQKIKEQTPRLNKSIYQKYLKEFKSYEQNFKKQVKEQVNYNDVYGGNDLENHHNNGIVTPVKNQQENDQVFKTYSMKKKKSQEIRIILANPSLSQKIVKINKIRSQIDAPLIEAIGVEMRNQIWVIGNESKTQVLLAWLSKPKMIISVNFFNALEMNPCLQINDKIFERFQVKYKMNIGLVEGKTVALFDSVIGLQFLEKVIKECNGEVLLPKRYLFSKQVADIIISNKKTAYLQKADQRMLSEANFINELLQFDS